jgi:alkylation response protein AidB-like acyl-CoA dehydrogenase
MDFELSDDQEALRAAARALLDGRSGRAVVRSVVDASGGWDAELWKAMVEQGWTGLALPEDEGGLGLGMVELALVLEEVGAHVSPAPVLQQALVLGALSGTGSPWSPRLLGGEVVGCAAWPPVTAAGGRLSGRPAPVLYAPSADVAVVPADDGLYAVDLRGRRPPREPAMDLTREVGWIELQEAPAERVGGPEAVAAYLDRGATAYAAELLGASVAMLDMTVQYAKDRVQFGRPIGSFQAVKHRCADMLVDVEGMRSTVYHAAWCLSAGHPEASIAASTAKVWCSDAARRVMASGLQVHGGIGFTWEHDVHLFLKRAHLDSLAFGDAREHRARLSRLLRTRVEAGDSVL